MLRAIAAVIVGYVATFIVVAASFAGIAFMLGNERVYDADTLNVSTTWIMIALALSVAGALVGGSICGLIARPSTTPVKVFAGLVLVFGMATAFYQMRSETPALPADRTIAELSVLERAQYAKQPTWYAFTIPWIGAAGVLFGGALARRKPSAPAA